MQLLRIILVGIFFLVSCKSTPPLIIKDSLDISTSKPGDKSQIWSDSQNRYYTYTFVRVFGPCKGVAKEYTESYDCRCETVISKAGSHEKCDTCYRHIQECRPHANLKCEPTNHPACQNGRISIDKLRINCCDQCQFNVEQQDKYGVTTETPDIDCENTIDRIVLIRDEQKS